MARTGWPPGPRRTISSILPLGLGRDPLAFITDLARTYGDVAHINAAGEHLVLLNHPQLVKDLLITRYPQIADAVIHIEPPPATHRP